MQYLYIYSFGKVKDITIQTLISDISKRVKYFKHIELKECRGKNSQKVQLLEKEELDKKVFSKHRKVIICSEKGKEYSTTTFAQFLHFFDDEIVFVISSAFGSHKETINRASHCISLSQMTFTHEMALYILLEQCYRVQCLENNVSYTK